MTLAQVAQAMNLSRRAYQRFESGETPTDIGRLMRFSQVLDCDPAALLCLPLVDEALVLRLTNNKLLLVVLLAFESFGKSLGEDLRRLDAYALIERLERCLSDLAAEQGARDAATRRWLRREPPETSDTDS